MLRAIFLFGFLAVFIVYGCGEDDGIDSVSDSSIAKDSTLNVEIPEVILDQDNLIEADSLLETADPLINTGIYLSSVYDEDSLIHSFSYNDEGRLSSQVERHSRTTYEHRTFVYNEIGKISKSIGTTRDDNIEMSLYYDNDTLLDSVYMVIGNRVWESIKFLYNENNEIMRKIQFPIGWHGILIYTDYTWVNGNMVSSRKHFPESSSTVFISEFTYDSLINPYIEVYKGLGIDLTHFEPISKNNLVSVIIVGEEFNQFVSKAHATYSYMENGYPISMRLEVDLGGLNGLTTTNSNFNYQ